jgi:hypothetical protein
MRWTRGSGWTCCVICWNWGGDKSSRRKEKGLGNHEKHEGHEKEKGGLRIGKGKSFPRRERSGFRVFAPSRETNGFGLARSREATKRDGEGRGFWSSFRILRGFTCLSFLRVSAPPREPFFFFATRLNRSVEEGGIFARGEAEARRGAGPRKTRSARMLRRWHLFREVSFSCI